jgi:hypothetical protein
MKLLKKIKSMKGKKKGSVIDGKKKRTSPAYIWING